MSFYIKIYILKQYQSGNDLNLATYFMSSSFECRKVDWFRIEEEKTSRVLWAFFKDSGVACGIKSTFFIFERGIHKLR